MNSAVASSAAVNPYPGLRAFEFEENDVFFGREGKAKEIADRLAHSHFVAVVGTSGSGKSSLVRAGLLPLLYGGMLSELGSHWRISVMRPGDAPIRNLARSLVCHDDFFRDKSVPPPTEDATQIGIAEGTLRRSGVGLINFVKNPANRFAAGENLLVVVDQFEELFRYKEKSAHEETEEAAAFVKLLLEAVRDETSGVFVVITMRSDFLGDCAEFTDLPEAINRGQYLIPRMTREQLRQSIEAPALVSGARVSPPLVSRLLNDLEGEQSHSADIRERMLRDPLPVLQHAVMRTWKVWDDKNTPNEPIDVAHYEETGGMTLALSNHAEEAFADLDKESANLAGCATAESEGRQAKIAEKMFKCLTDVDSENRETRRPARVAEICAVAKAGVEEVAAVVEIFRKKERSFLMPPPGVRLDAQTMIDISHESLIRNWERLKGWVRKESDDAWQYRRLAEQAFLYEGEFGKSEAALWSGVVLADAVEWREKFKPTFDWAKRYQFLTDEEKAGLAKLRKIPAAEREKIRRKLLGNHIEKVKTFLDESVKKEAEKKEREKQIQQDKIEREREKTEAAQSLARAERERKEELEALTDRLELERSKLEASTVILMLQRKRLRIVSTVSIFLTVTSVIAAVVAWQFQRTARAAEDEAKQQKEIALIQKQEADEQRAEAVRQKESADEAKANAEDAERDALLQKNEAEKQRQVADDKTDEAEAQRQIAEAEAQNALEQEQIAKSEKQKAVEQKNEAERLKKTADDNAESARINAEEAEAQKDKLATEQRRTKKNLDGLFALESLDYADAEIKFGDLMEYAHEPDRLVKMKYDWWANYNIAKTRQQRFNFENTVDSFNEALRVIDSYQKPRAKNAGAIPDPRDYFMFASYRDEKIQDSDVTNFKIITLRKFAQFYRFCAQTPEKCFEDYARLRTTGFGYANPEKSAAGERLEVDIKTLNESAVARYEQLLKIPRIEKPDSDNDKLKKADVQNELADILNDLERFEDAKKNYREAFGFYKTYNQPFGISVMKSWLGTILRQSQMEEAEPDKNKRLKEAEVLARDVLEQTRQAYDKNNKKPILYDPVISQAYHELANVYRFAHIYGFQSRKIEEAKLKHAGDAELFKILDGLDYYSDAALDSFVIPDRLSLEQKQALNDLKNDLADYYSTVQILRHKATTLEKVGASISYGAAASDENKNSYLGALAAAYAANGEYCKALDVIGEYAKTDAAETSPLMRAGSLAYFYNHSVRDDKKAAENYEYWRAAVHAAAVNGADSDQAIGDKIAYYWNAGAFYYSCAGCPNNLADARRVFTEHLDYLEKNGKPLFNPGADAETADDYVLANRIALQILIGQTYADENKAETAIPIYEKTLGEIQTRRKKKEDDLSSSANLKSDGGVSSNANAKTATNASDYNSANSGDFYQAGANPSLRGEFLFYEDYLRAGLARLYFDKDNARARKFLGEYKPNVSLKDPAWNLGVFNILFKTHAANLKTIGSRLRSENDAQAANYYQASATMLENFHRRTPADDSLSHTPGSPPADADYIDILKILRELKGANAEINQKINAAEANLKVVKRLEILGRENDACAPGGKTAGRHGRAGKTAELEGENPEQAPPPGRKTPPKDLADEDAIDESGD